MKRQSLFIMCGLMLSMALSATAKDDPSLVGWWRLDDGKGIIAVDSSGHGNDGEFVGNPQWVPGMIGPALYLDGDSWVEIPHSDILTVDNEVTVAAWVKADQLDDDGSGYAGIVAKSNGPRSYSLYTTGNGTLHFSVNGTAGNSTTALVIGEWTHVTAMIKGGTKYYFFNGVPDPVSVSGVTLPGLADTATVLIGNTHEDLEREFHGIIDDVRIYNRGLEEAELAKVMQGSPPELAENPVPGDESVDALRDGILTWESGMYDSTHNVYFGSSLDTVSNATVPTAAGLNVNSFDPGRLEFGATYYWRVDEVNVTPDRTVHKGEVWSFQVEPYSIMIPVDVSKVTASSSAAENPAGMTVNGSGLDGSTHSADSDDMWLSAMPDLNPWLMVEFDQAQKIDQMKIWNSNSVSEAFVGWGLKDINIETSVDGVVWTSLTEEPIQISRAPGLPTYSAPDVIDFGLVQAKYVRINILNNWGGVVMQYGVSEVQFYGLPVQARMPVPASGSAEVLPSSALSWRAGREADQHTVYVSMDPNAVADGSAPSVSSMTNSVSLSSLDLELGNTYYWRVDEVNDAQDPSVWAGPVWSLSTVEAVSVDNFEKYNNFSPDRPFQAWIDGVGYSADEFYPVANAGNGTGAAVGHDIWSPSSPYYNGKIMEETISITGSTQSLPFYYDNTSGTSHIDRTFAVPQDWTAGAVETLVLWVHGQLSNADTNKLYVKINNTKVTYPGDISVPIWKQWNVDLTSLGANLSAVTTLSIGVEGSGSGLLYLDDISLYRIAPAVVGPPAGSDPSLVGYWALDETEGLTAADSSGYGNDGTLVGMTGTEWTAGLRGGALKFSGVGGDATQPNIVTIEDSTSLQLNGSVTISAWAKMNEGNAGVYMGIAGKLNSSPYQGFALVRHSSNFFYLWANSADFQLAGHQAQSDVVYTDTEWHHVAGVVDGSTSTLYVDGVKQATQGDGVALQDGGTNAYIGRQYGTATSYRYWNGLIDEVRIYYRALTDQEISGL